VALAACFADAAPRQEESHQGDNGTDIHPMDPQGGYQLGPGDVIDIAVYDEADLTRLATIQHAGEISFPLIGEVQLAGLTQKEAQELLERLLAEDFLVDPQVTVRVKEYLSKWVTLVGEVARPDKYYLKGPTAILDLLTEAGGFTAQASGEVVISRMSGTFDDGETTRRIWLSREMSVLEQKAALAFTLVASDLVTVSAQAFFYISGEVKNPGSYPLTAGLTILNAVSLGGGLSKFGSTGKVVILRKNGSGKPERIKVNLKDIEQGKKPDIALVAGDIVKVGKRIF
jgi:polysaccharide export outer membrane protein